MTCDSPDRVAVPCSAGCGRVRYLVITCPAKSKAATSRPCRVCTREGKARGPYKSVKKKSLLDPGSHWDRRSDRTRTVAPLDSERQQLVVDEIARKWVYAEVRNLSPWWLVKQHGYDELNAVGIAAIVESAETYRDEFGVPFGAYARQLVRWTFWKLTRTLTKEIRAWNEMRLVSRDDGETSQLSTIVPDHRRYCPSPALHLWCSLDYSEQRRCLDWRSRIALYLLAVEGMNLSEAGESLGITRERVRQIEKRAVAKLAGFRVRRLEQLTVRETRAMASEVQP